VHEDSEIRRLLGDAATRAVTESMPGLLVAARAFSSRTWDAELSPHEDPLERRFGPVHMIVSRRWMPQPPDERRLAWKVEDHAVISLAAMAGSHHTPSLEEYLEQRGGVTQDGYYRFGAAPLTHATGFTCWELGETAPQLPGQPTRFLRMMRGKRSIIVLSVEAQGAILPSVGLGFAASFHSIRLG